MPSVVRVPSAVLHAWSGSRRVVRLAAALAAALVLVLALWLRIWTSSPMWLDEAQSVGIAGLPLAELLDGLRADGAPPLYYLLLHGWIGLFGTGDFAVRSLSLVLSLIAVGLLWVVGRRLGGSHAVGAIAALVGATNPWMVRYASEARMYALVVVLVLLAALAAEAVFRRGRRRDVAWLALASGALLLTHYWAMFLVAGGLVVLAALAYRHPPLRPRALSAAAGLAAGGVLFLPWLPSFFYQVARTGAPWADLPGLSRLASLPLDWAGGETPSGRWLLLILLPLLVLGAFASPRRPGDGPRVALGAPLGRWLALLTVVTLLLAVAVTRVTSSGIEPRYTAVVVPLVLLLVSLGVLALPRRAAAAAVVALAGLGLMASWDAVQGRRTQAPDFAAALEDYAMPGDVLVYCPDQLAPSVSRLLSPQTSAALRSVPVPASSELNRVDWVDYEKRVEDVSAARLAETTSATAGRAAVWTLTSPRYRTHDVVCPGLRGELSDRGRRSRTVVSMDAGAYEYAVLERWTPRSPWETAANRFGRLGAAAPADG